VTRAARRTPIWIYLLCALLGAGAGWLVLRFNTPAEPDRPPPAPAPTEDQIRRIPELLALLTAQDDPRPGDQHGPCHKIKPSVERELWSIVSVLPVRTGHDKWIIEAVDQVYTRYHSNYYVGYIFHYPYLDSDKTIRLCDKLLREYPGSEHVPLALWLKAFALRVKPPPPGGERAESFEAQFRWNPRPQEARAVYRKLIDRWAGHPYAERAAKLLEKEPFLIELPISFDDDPRSQ
jgi:hypothetical protein